jgi:hypothetical protein
VLQRHLKRKSSIDLEASRRTPHQKILTAGSRKRNGQDGEGRGRRADHFRGIRMVFRAVRELSLLRK